MNNDISIHSQPELQAWLQRHPELRQPVEVWTRVMGYHRPVSEFNPGKRSEQRERTCFIESASIREVN